MPATNDAAPFPLETGKGAAYIHSPVVACYGNDMGVFIMCARCGHEYVASKPLSDGSQTADNIELAKALWFHNCANEGRQAREVERRARKPKF